MNRIEVRMFSRLIRRLTCKQLKSLLRKNGRRLQAAQSGFGNFMRAKLIRTLKAKRKMNVKRQELQEVLVQDGGQVFLILTR